MNESIYYNSDKLDSNDFNTITMKDNSNNNLIEFIEDSLKKHHYDIDTIVNSECEIFKYYQCQDEEDETENFYENFESFYSDVLSVMNSKYYTIIDKYEFIDSFLNIVNEYEYPILKIEKLLLEVQELNNKNELCQLVIDETVDYSEELYKYNEIQSCFNKLRDEYFK